MNKWTQELVNQDPTRTSNPKPTPTRLPIIINISIPNTPSPRRRPQHSYRTVIHPRARIYSYDGPVIIGEGCIISEKSTIGIPPSTPPSLPPTPKEVVTTRISNGVTIGPLVTVFPGAHIHSFVTVESLAIINRRVSLGAHSKVCSGCEIAANTVIRDWTVVWGSGAGSSQRRKRATGKMSSSVAVGQDVSALDAKVVEDARLIILQKEREVVARLIGSSASAGGRRK
ncbi:transferase hexapeptide domain protein [Aspergillus novofumigatus IBT 16806]|uniref:Dynactin subunit 6 n=1 Tax=Aspergillus novofumigatus (strain IBT 16806) TaxID=1392255 RepID=A0A2I1CBJ5_ASPN1|nr:uncharacterized protein P174DRAFT_449526 [Aspergillus novofumigatus IBT 16806]PKX95009.1 hypothetical protein P174DRAFT_449526 [Aspergillus novofumigatus IBT 16806]